MKMKRFLLIGAVMVWSVSMAFAHDPQKFSPEKFQADLEQFITQEAGLTSEESTKFFPLYREMQQKQRVIYKQMKELGKNKPSDEASCRKAVERRDELELEQIRLHQNYHKQFLRVIPASKVYEVLRAEARFHRRAFKNWGNPPHKHQPRK